MWYLKEDKTNKVLTTMWVSPDAEEKVAWIYKDMLETINEETRGIPIVFAKESDAYDYIRQCNRIWHNTRLKVFKLMEVEWE